MSQKKILQVSPIWRCKPFSERSMFKTYSAELHSLSGGKNMKFYVGYGMAGVDEKPCLMVYETINRNAKGTPAYNAVYVVAGMPEFELENGSDEDILMLAKSEGICLWERRVEQSASSSATTEGTNFKREIANPLTWVNPGSAQASIYKENTNWATKLFD